MLLEVEAQIEEGLRQDAFHDQHETHEQPAHSSVSIQEGVDSLELRVREPGLDHRSGETVLIVEEALQAVERGAHLVRWWRHEAGVARPGAADPVLGAAELPGRLVAAPCALHQDTVNFPDEPQREGELAAPEPLDAMLERCHVARDFPHLGHRGARYARGLEAQEVGEGGLGTLDGTREDGFLADVHVEQPVGLERGGYAFEAAKGASRRLAQALQLGGEPERRVGRQAGGEEGRESFRSRLLADPAPGAGGSGRHRGNS